jgi:hypothetical protein
MVTSTRAEAPLAVSTLPSPNDVARPMELLQRSLVELAWDSAAAVTAQTRATRRYSEAQRDAWFRWRLRWHELEDEAAVERTLVVCATCTRYRDGRGRWVLMPSGLSTVLANTRSLCVSHGLCSVCTTQALHDVRKLTPSEPVPTGATSS